MKGPRWRLPAAASPLPWPCRTKAPPGTASPALKERGQWGRRAGGQQGPLFVKPCSSPPVPPACVGEEIPSFPPRFLCTLPACTFFFPPFLSLFFFSCFPLSLKNIRKKIK